MADLCLERAHGAPIDIAFVMPDVDTPFKLPTALPASAPWLRSLAFHGQDSEEADILLVSSEFAAPRLEEREFDLLSDEHVDVHDLRIECPLFSGEAPSLMELTIRDCIFSWDWRLLRIHGLTSTDLEIGGHSLLPRPSL